VLRDVIMLDIPTGSHIFDVCFSPDLQYIYVGLLSGEVKGALLRSRPSSCPIHQLIPTKGFRYDEH
jgi:hypothetical protein